MMPAMEEPGAQRAPGEHSSREESKLAEEGNDLSHRGKVLIVDDDEGFLHAVTKLIESLDYQVSCAGTVEQAKGLVESETFCHVFLDLMLPDGSGFELLRTVETEAGDAPGARVTLVTGDSSIKQMVRRMYGPRVNYLLKPIAFTELEQILQGPRSTGGRNAGTDYHGLIGRSPQMRKLYETIERVAPSSANVLIMGESGVGKELVAEAIHAVSGATGSFVAANCAGFNRELVGSELFGHEKGAFTGAHSRRKGLFEQAQGGTLFLDEITEMPPELQATLLRVLETKRCTRVGGTSSLDVASRVVSATNRSERDIAESSTLRSDLLFRLAAYPLKVPPLRERKEDIEDLTWHFLRIFSKEYGVALSCPASALEKLQSYDWPGNVRELQHTIHRAVILGEGGTELVLPEPIGTPFSAANLDGADNVLRPGQSIEEVEKILIEMTLERYGNDKKQAAEVLGVSLKTLYNRINAYAKRDQNPAASSAGGDPDDSRQRNA